LVKISAKTASALPPFEAGNVYTIKSAEQVKTQLRGLDGIRVVGELEDGTSHAEMLWLREVVGKNSKLGSFLEVLGDETEKWVGKRIHIVSWSPKNRLIKLVQEKKR
jgi:hypothetical protein